jgi:hypothetical protein
MGLGELLTWQWSGYGKVHTAKANLLLHIGAVPLFILGNVTFLAGLFQVAPVLILVSVAAMSIGLTLQGRGHKLEPVPPEPFTSPANAFVRLLCEQWITFPRFVLSGGWYRALKRAA